MRQVGFITSSEDPQLTADDRLVRNAFREKGWEVCSVIWEQWPPKADLDAVIFRSCWNYHRKTGEFFNFLSALAKTKIPIFNPISRIHWNTNKSYLLELETQGALIPSTTFIKRGQAYSEKQFSAIETSDLVLKPAVSLNGEDTFLFNSKDKATFFAKLSSMSEARDVIVQEFIPEIRNSGEISFVFFNQCFSHAIRKVPQLGEFRVQVEHGGSRIPFTPSEEQLLQAKKILELVPEELLYARVDVVERDEKLILIELEIIDPMLFFASSAAAPVRFAEAFNAMYETKTFKNSEY